jgi:hypothetical protein
MTIYVDKQIFTMYFLKVLVALLLWIHIYIYVHICAYI